MTELTYTDDQRALMAVAESMGAETAGVLASIFAKAEQAKRPRPHLAAQTDRPEGVPQDFRRIAIDSQGYNNGQYIFGQGDYHLWLPPEEACKERPNLNLGIRDIPDFRQKRQAGGC